MMNRPRKIIVLVFMLISSISNQITTAQDNCNIKNTSFQPGESITYELSYNWGIPWLKVGYAKFSVKKKQLNSKPHYHLIGVGSSYESWDWFYKMRASYESYVNMETFNPTYYKRKTKEPDFFIDQEYRFNWKDTVAYSKYESKKHSLRYDTIATTPCTYDLISILYYARNLDYSKYKKGEKIPYTLLLDREIMHLEFKYLGEDNVKIRKIGRFNCLKFSISLVAGSMFDEGDEMTLWVTKDANRIPVMIKTPIVVGSVKAKLIDYKNLKHPLNSLN